MSRPRSRPVRALVRATQCSRLEQECLGRAYELALPILRRRAADAPQPQPRPHWCPLPVPQRHMGG
jgi:hypothetical protein